MSQQSENIKRALWSGAIAGGATMYRYPQASLQVFSQTVPSWAYSAGLMAVAVMGSEIAHDALFPLISKEDKKGDVMSSVVGAGITAGAFILASNAINADFVSSIGMTQVLMYSAVLAYGGSLTYDLAKTFTQ